jgi:hypothetical protein
MSLIETLEPVRVERRGRKPKHKGQEEHNRALAARVRAARAAETPVERAIRLQKQRDYYYANHERYRAYIKEWRRNRSPEQKARDAETKRRYDNLNRAKLNAQELARLRIRRARETPAQKEARLAMVRAAYRRRRANETPAQRQIRLRKEHERRQQRKLKRMQAA